jgi:hypothetical protein
MAYDRATRHLIPSGYPRTVGRGSKRPDVGEVNAPQSSRSCRWGVRAKLGIRANAGRTKGGTEKRNP